MMLNFPLTSPKLLNVRSFKFYIKKAMLILATAVLSLLICIYIYAYKGSFSLDPISVTGNLFAVSYDDSL